MTDLRPHLEQARRSVAEIAPAELAVASRALVIDVREREEWNLGHLPGAVHCTRGFLELRIGQLAPDPAHPLVLYCQTGVRSLLAAATLQQLGYRDVRWLAGGIQAWMGEGRDVAAEDGMRA